MTPSEPTPDLIRTPNTVRPIMTSDEILGHVDKAMSALPPEAHDAIGQAHGLLGINAPAKPEEAPFTDGIKPPRMGGLPATLPEPPALGGTGAPPPIAGIKAPSRLQGLPPSPAVESNTARLQHLQNSPTSGIAGIKNPYGRIPLQILDAVGRGLFPGIEMGIPGTSGHHDVLLNQAENAVEGDQRAVAATDKSRLENAQADVQEALPELNDTKTELARTRQSGIDEHNRATETQAATAEQGRRDTAAERERTTLAAHGFEKNEKGEIAPLPYERMSQEQQAIHDLKSAQSEMADASAALKKAQAENQPAMIELQMRRLAHGEELTRVAAKRLNLSGEQFEFKTKGTVGGVPQAGGLITDSGDTVGTANAANVRPTGQERNKADMAGSAKEQLVDIRRIVSARPDIFGPVEGRKTDFDTWLGSQDPDAQRFRSARTIAADHLAGTFGGRSEAALTALDQAIGSFKDNPKAVLAGLDQIEKANDIFIKKGTPKTTGSDAATGTKPLPAPKAGEVRDGFKYKGGPVNEQSSWEAVKK